MSGFEPCVVALCAEGRLFARYHHGPDLTRPYFDLVGPGGRPVTRVRRPGDDHPHHRGVWTGHRDVSGVDHWTELPGHGRIIHDGFDAIDAGGFVERLRWVDADGRPALTEVRAVRLQDGGAMDVEVRLRAPDRQIVLGDTKDAALVAVRVGPRTPSISNSEGGRGESECWGRRAAWCDVSGPDAGVAVLDHPHNPRHPTPWHARDYGMVAANPFGLRALEAAPEADGSIRLAPGDEIAFRHRLIVHGGDVARARLVDRWREWAEAP